MTLWNPHLDMFAQIQGAHMQIHKYQHSLKDILSQASSVPKLIESESLKVLNLLSPFTEQKKLMTRFSGVNRKHASRRVEFVIWLEVKPRLPLESHLRAVESQ